ncbi:hypothetical protein [Clostridium butyricum]|uniref:hypothetical protein n=1 Tax=Clostridium butyricum TaxID=1492 RepID=UPI0013D2CFEB|nr:hypothetical protein [Clostridium butyricum]MCQ2022258.1 hypothetical protein [Clostridium butyricum]NFB70123.1 hypothetical protein [Clostridium butyricum]NFB89910.1 hypothetical protein [Clostridium butyricum]
MEYKLNKIDTNIRVKLQQETSNDKIHYSKKINKTEDLIEERKKSSNNFSDNNKHKKHNKDKIVINGIKYNDKLNVEAMKLEELTEYNAKGRTLDIKK